MARALLGGLKSAPPRPPSTGKSVTYRNLFALFERDPAARVAYSVGTNLSCLANDAHSGLSSVH
jgi:hypothetical protein